MNYEKFIKKITLGNKFILTKQSQNIGRHNPSLNTFENGFIDWNVNSYDLYNFINAFDEPYKGASTYLDNGDFGKLYLKKVHLHGGDSSNHPFMSGIVSRHDKNWIVVSTKSKHMLLIEEVLYNDGNNRIAFDLNSNSIEYGSGIQNRTAKIQYIKDGWYYLEGNVEGRNGGWVPSLGIANEGRRPISWTPTETQSAYFAAVQIEAYRSFATPFVEQERTSTEALLDLTKNNIIDLSDTLTSYDSQGRIIFDGTDDQIVQPYDMVGMTDYTITVWAKSDVDRSTLTQTHYSALGGHFSGGSYLRYDIKDPSSSTPGYILFWAAGPDTFTSYNFPEDFDINTWHEYTYTHSPSYQRMYVDGVLVKGVLINNNEPLTISYTRIGRYAGSYWSGEINVYRIYNKALTAEEIAVNYNTLQKRFNIE